jgi:membrane protein required for colicin V production
MHTIIWVDYAIVGVICISTLIGLLRGFVKETLSLVTWFVAFIVGFKLSDQLSGFFSSITSNDSLRTAIAFALLFIAILILGSIISHFIVKLISKKGLKGFDRALGMLFGFARGVLVIGVVLLLLSVNSTEESAWQKESYLVPKFNGLVNWLHTFLPNKVETQVEDVAN